MTENRFAKIVWDQNGVPRSAVFDDQYFCQDNGYEEALHVCCRGNRLAERFRSLDPGASGTFTIMETGFGTGLDFCCAWKTFSECAPASWRLHFISVELYPLLRDDLARALGLWKEIAPCREGLTAQYDPLPGGMAEMIFGEGRIRLTIIFDDVLVGLKRIKDDRIAPQGADAFFLDGFGPAKNPCMWGEDVCLAMVPFCRPGTTVSTFTVAGAVRRGLQKAGFTLHKIPGHGRKRQILTGCIS